MPKKRDRRHNVCCCRVPVRSTYVGHPAEPKRILNLVLLRVGRVHQVVLPKRHTKGKVGIGVCDFGRCVHPGRTTKELEDLSLVPPEGSRLLEVQVCHARAGLLVLQGEGGEVLAELLDA